MYIETIVRDMRVSMKHDQKNKQIVVYIFATWLSKEKYKQTNNIDIIRVCHVPGLAWAEMKFAHRLQNLLCTKHINIIIWSFVLLIEFKQRLETYVPIIWVLGCQQYYCVV